MKEQIIRHLSRDPVLRPIIDKVEYPEPSQSDDIYGDLLVSIISQQLSGKAARTIHDRFLDLFPYRDPSPDRVMAFDLETLRSAGLSRRKATHVQNVAAFFADGAGSRSSWEDMMDEEIVSILTGIKGVGRWTVQMILMFSLDRPDVFPIDDLGVRQAMIELYGLQETGKELRSRLESTAEPWRPYRSVACKYLWRHKDS